MSSAERHPHRPYLESAGGSVSYSAAVSLTRWWSGTLTERGVRSGDRVAVIARNRTELPLLVFAASAVGATAVLLDPGLRPAALWRILRQVEPSLVITEGGEEAGAAAFPVHSIEDITDLEVPPSPRVAWEPVPVDRTAAALLIYTSGTTGEPLGVTVSHENVLFTARGIQARLEYRRTDRIGLYLPLSFDYGLYQAFLAAIAGACLVVERPADVGPDFLRRITERAITVLPAVPTLVSGLLALLERSPGAAPVLRAVTSTGDRLPPAHIQRLSALLPGARVFPMYGLTECKRVSILLPGEVGERPGSVGRPLEGVDVRITDPEGRELPTGRRGEIRVRGPNLCMGYWRRPEETAAVFADDGAGQRELRTGDYGRLDSERYLYVDGREDALVKHRGYRISAHEIEAAAARCPGVVDAAMVRLDEPDELHLFVSGEPGVDDLLRTRLAEQLETYKLPSRIHLLGELPLTTNRKIDRSALLRLARGEEGVVP